jgi:L-lactate dehydrogenase complex protein LldF
MKINSNRFIASARDSIKNPNLQSAVSYGTNLANTKRKAAVFQTSMAHGEKMRQQAAAIKRLALNNLPELLEQAEKQMTKNGVKVLWAKDADEANQHIYSIIQQKNICKIVKSKSMVTEEIGLNTFLEERAIEVIETDLGEYIIQISNDHPSHIVVPVIHRTKESIKKTLMEKIGMPDTEHVSEMTHFVRGHMRKHFLEAEMGISGGNFVIAESGSVCLTTNEGNGRMVTSFPKTHVAVIGIEKVIASYEDYATLAQMLPRSATGQTMTVYTNIINGPRRTDEEDGPENMYVIFLDNGRSDIYNSGYAEALACIRCGACLNACPVYQVTGGHAYGWVYPGPIGAVVSPLLIGIENASPLPQASSLCGNCKQVCPVDIDIPRMLLDLRYDLVKTKKDSFLWRSGMRIWSVLYRSNRLLNLFNKVSKIGRWLPVDLFPGILKKWSRYRKVPKPAPRSFKEIWHDQLKADK